MKNRVEAFIKELEANTPAIAPTPLAQQGGKRLASGSIVLHQAPADFRTHASFVLARLLQKLGGRAVEYVNSEVPQPFDAEKFAAYHAHPDLWDRDHKYRAGTLELITGAQDVMPKEYDPSIDTFTYDPTTSDALADEPSAHVVWHFPRRRFDGYLLKSSLGTLEYQILSPHREALETVRWITEKTGELLAENFGIVRMLAQQEEYTDEL